MHFVVSSSQFVSSGGLTKGLYAQHHCLALDGFKLGGLFYLSLLLRVFYFGGYQLIITYIFYPIITYRCFLSKMFSVLSGFIYFKMAPSLAIQESIIRVEIMGTLFLRQFFDDQFFQ